nr:hypothetical protein [Tanacetum cinerariifolium]
FFCQNLQFCWSQTSHTNSSNKILKPIFGDTEYGCAWKGSAARGCMRLLWLTESRSTMLADNATYSAYADDIAVQFCFFDIQLTNLSPKNCIPPEVLLRESMHPA